MTTQEKTFDGILLALWRKARDHESEIVLKEIEEFIKYCGREEILKEVEV